MGVKTDTWIVERCASARMIEPHVSELVRESGDVKVISYGPSSYGYDIRCGYSFKIFTNVNTAVLDPKEIDKRAFVEVESELGEPVLIPPNSFALTHSLEYLRIPRDVLCLSTPKSTYARAGVLVPTTVLEPEWEGHLTIEISNTTPLPARVWPGEGISQLVFFGADLEASQAPGLLPVEWLRTLHRPTCAVSYADRKGKYQGQTGITLPHA